MKGLRNQQHCLVRNPWIQARPSLNILKGVKAPWLALKKKPSGLAVWNLAFQRLPGDPLRSKTSSSADACMSKSSDHLL